MKKKYVISFFKDERVSLPISIQRTESKTDKWHQWYLSFLFWCFSILIVDKREN